MWMLSRQCTAVGHQQVVGGAGGRDSACGSSPEMRASHHIRSRARSLLWPFTACGLSALQPVSSLLVRTRNPALHHTQHETQGRGGSNPWLTLIFLSLSQALNTWLQKPRVWNSQGKKLEVLFSRVGSPLATFERATGVASLGRGLLLYGPLLLENRVSFKYSLGHPHFPLGPIKAVEATYTGTAHCRSLSRGRVPLKEKDGVFC